MGMTAYLVILFLVLFVLNMIALTKGKTIKKWVPIAITTVVLVMGLAFLVYLWIASPM